MIVSLLRPRFVVLGFMRSRWARWARALARDGGFAPPSVETFPDAGSEAGDESCDRVRCSYDSRSIVKNCTEEVVTTCPPELACGDAECVDPCTAAEREKGSRGCEFYFQPPPLYSAINIIPRARRAATQRISSTYRRRRARVRLEYGNQELDLTDSVYTLKQGDTTLAPHEGPIGPGEAVVVFLADPPGSDHIKCPDGGPCGDDGESGQDHPWNEHVVPPRHVRAGERVDDFSFRRRRQRLADRHVAPPYLDVGDGARRHRAMGARPHDSRPVRAIPGSTNRREGG